MEFKTLHRVRVPICENSNKGAFIVHFFSTKEKALEFSSNKICEVLPEKVYPVENGYVTCGKIDK